MAADKLFGVLSRSNCEILRSHFDRFFQSPSSGRRVASAASLSAALLSAVAVPVMSGCVMSEEMKRIESNEKAQRQRAEASSSDLTGEQIFIRSCNTCHPQGKAGMGPSLENVPTKFGADAALIAFLRKGQGMMPPQTKDVLNDQEMGNLVIYLRQLTAPEESGAK